MDTDNTLNEADHPEVVVCAGPPTCLRFDEEASAADGGWMPALSSDHRAPRRHRNRVPEANQLRPPMWKVVRIHNGRRPFALEHSDGRMLRTLILRGVHRRDGAIRVWQDHPNAQREADRLNEEQPSPQNLAPKVQAIGPDGELCVKW